MTTWLSPPTPSASVAFWVTWVTAWENWRVAVGVWRIQMPELDPDAAHVWSWGGGVGLLVGIAGLGVQMVRSVRERRRDVGIHAGGRV